MGDGPYRPALERQVRQLHLSGYVEFTGALDDAALADWYRRASIFVFTPQPNSARGEMEGFGLVCVEAGAGGCPIVAWKTGGVGEAVIDGETGLVVNYEDWDGLISSLVQIMQSPELAARLGQGGYRRACHLSLTAASILGEESPVLNRSWQT